MQVWASVNEADIGNIHAGPDGPFTVDAYPGRDVQGMVEQDPAQRQHDARTS